jgi:xylan 1,4-beta-xylosidase
MRKLFSLILASSCGISAAQEQAQVTVRFTNTVGKLEMSKMALGQGGLSEEPMWNDRITEIGALKPAVIRLFIQEYFNLLPEAGRYNFTTLDRSVDTILATGAKPLMTICFKPHVLFPQINHDIVEPNDYAEWEKLIFNMVRHYKEKSAGIRYWEVANEPDIGESGGCPYRFKPENYVRYYEHTVSAILRADPEAHVGGPALANHKSPILPALLQFCDTNQAPLHFISWHIYNSSPGAIHDTIVHVKALLKEHPALKPETFLNEWNMDLMNPPRDPRFQPCYVAESVWQMLDAGLDYSCYYHIRDWHVNYDTFAKFMSVDGVAMMTRWWNRMPQFDGLFDYQNSPRPAYFAFKLLSRCSGERLELTSSQAGIRGLAAHDPKLRMYNIMLWNFSPKAAQAKLSLLGLPRKMRMRHLTLDAQSASSDENIRLRPEPPMSVKQGEDNLMTELEPYGVQFWMIE